jgi:hypothetical protein
MVGLWFAGAAFGALVVAAELVATFISFDSYAAMVSVHLPDLLLYIGGPVSGGIVTYMLKSAFENKAKIEKQYIPDYDQEESGGIDYGNVD